MVSLAPPWECGTIISPVSNLAKLSSLKASVASFDATKSGPTKSVSPFAIKSTDDSFVAAKTWIGAFTEPPLAALFTNFGSSLSCTSNKAVFIHLPVVLTETGFASS